MKKINMNNILLLGSQSPSRQMLLREAQIPFTLIEQKADESQCDWGLSLPQVVQNIAQHKMDHVVIPESHKGDECFVLTADTLSQNLDGTLQGKPSDRVDAMKKIKEARKGARLSSAFCLDKKIRKGNQWHTAQRIAKVVHAEYMFVIPDEWIDIYFEKSIGLQTAGAIAIEGFGGQFLCIMNGSYTSIVGLPMFELREALQEIGFFG